MIRLKGFNDFILESSFNPEAKDPSISKKFNFHLVPGNKNNYRSSQIPPVHLKDIINRYRIDRVIRLNSDEEGDGLDPDGSLITVDEEEKVCKENGCDFHFVDLKKEYYGGKTPQKIMEKVNPILDKGNCLIHCKYGKDRTGGSVGYHLLNSVIIPNLDDVWEYTVKYNNWMDLIRRGEFFGTEYEIFASCFYPPEELKESKWVKKK